MASRERKAADKKDSRVYILSRARGSRDVFNSGRFQKQRKKLTTRGRARNGLKPLTLKQEVPSNCKIGLFTNFLLGSNSSGRCGVLEERRGGDGCDLDFLQLAIGEDKEISTY